MSKYYFTYQEDPLKHTFTTISLPDDIIMDPAQQSATLKYLGGDYTYLFLGQNFESSIQKKIVPKSSKR